VTTTFVAHDPQRQELADAVRKLAGDFGHRAFADSARRGENAPELWKALAAAGYLGVSIPEEYGGGGGGIEDLAIVLEELSAQGCPIMLFPVLAVCASVLVRHASPGQKQAWLPGLADGSCWLSFGITEPDAGTNSHAIATRAERVGGGWRLSGTKYYITGADLADGFLVVARTGGDAQTGRSQLTLFLVPADSPGISKTHIATELTSPDKQFMLHFDDVALPADAVVGAEGEGLRLAFSGLNPERIVVAGMCNGLARYALDRAAEYARARTVWGAPTGTHQAVAHPLAECYAQLQLARLATQRAAFLYDHGHDASEASNVAKLAAADVAADAMDHAIQVHGGNGISREYGLADLWFIARVQKIAPVSREMILNYLAQHKLGLPKSY
jgi:alkylation response protein AidB-like acyl-CoA dehydrogenase